MEKFVIDNGSGSSKMGWGTSQNPFRVAPNFITRGKGNQNKLVAEEIESCKDFSNIMFRRPFDKGYLIDWSLQKQIWNFPETYKANLKAFEPSKIDLLLTEPPFNPESLRRNTYEVIFEEYKFGSLFNPTSASMVLWDVPNETNNSCAIVVDSGYSFTHVIPFYDNTKLTYATKRINVGGKLLTNYLKEIISYRQWNMMNETYLVNIVKERLCYMPLNYLQELEITKKKGSSNTVRRVYVLPDNITNNLGYIKDVDPTPAYPSHLQGHIKPEDQLLVMNNERLIPEILFTPSDIGINQAGVAETIVQCINEIPSELHEMFYQNIIITGGCTLFPGFKERLYAELRREAPSDFEVVIKTPSDPILGAWRGAAKFSQQDNSYNLFTISKKDYEEYGWVLCKRRFDSM